MKFSVGTSPVSLNVWDLSVLDNVVPRNVVWKQGRCKEGGDDYMKKSNHEFQFCSGHNRSFG
jgi:hypothetical protein